MTRKRLIAAAVYPLAVVLISISVAHSLHAPAAAQEPSRTPTGGTPWDLRHADQNGMFVFYDMPAQASQTGKPLDIGDFDGDGCGDIAITGQNASHGVNGVWRRGAGHVRILMNLCVIEGQVALEATDRDPGHPIITLYGAYPGDMAGTETIIGDFNGDGYDDLLVGAQNADGPTLGRPNAGAAYVLFGGPDFADHADIDLREPPADVLTLHGATEGDRFGLWVEGGDFDGDGFHDLLIGANQADGVEDRRINAGEAWIIYGTEDMIATYGAVVDMRTPPDDATRIIGADFDDLLGSCVVGGDLNNDGLDDAIISAALWRGSAGVGGLSFGGGDGPGNERYNSGETYVIFGRQSLRGSTLDLAVLVDASGAPVNDGLTVIYGADANDLLGEEIAVGDLDGDGRGDLVLGTLVGDGAGNQLEDAGEAWVIYTHAPFEGQIIDLADPPRGQTVMIAPDQPYSKGGDTVRVADVNGDGMGDLLYGVPNYDVVGYDLQVRRNAGMMAVLYGQEGGLPENDGLIVLPSGVPEGLQVQYVIGADTNDMMSYAIAAYDVDGDGFVDLAPNGMGGDGLTNTQFNAGEIYVINGAVFSAGQQPPVSGETVTAGPTATAAPPTPTPEPLPTLTIDLSQPGDVDEGRRLYRAACAGCHGFAGDGDGVGLPLVGSPFVDAASDEALLRFLQIGRSSDSPDNTTGVAMPAYGGRADWGEAELWDVVAYLRHLIARQTE